MVADIVVAFDTANELISIGIGRLGSDGSIVVLDELSQPAHRASNTLLIPLIDQRLRASGIDRASIACIVCGRGPGSFTGVRICLATAKGIASALEVPLFTVSTSDAVAEGLRLAGVTGDALVMADAMRKEVYPVRYTITPDAVTRLNPDIVIKAVDAPAFCGSGTPLLAGDALVKYGDLLSDHGMFAEESLRTVTGSGLLAAAEARFRGEHLDPHDRTAGNPADALPVYTRLSDAEENERARLAAPTAPDLKTGVAGASPEADRIIAYRPLAAADVPIVAALEQQVMGSDAWNEAQLFDDIARTDRIWTGAYRVSRDAVGGSGDLVGYVGGWVVDGELQILKIATDPAHRRLGVARGLMESVCAAARDLGAHSVSLEVRVSNEGAHAFYERCGMTCIGTRPRYYSDREDARIYRGPLVVADEGVAGMKLIVDAAREASHSLDDSSRPLIFAIESSCDETAAAIVDGTGSVIADVVASQIDFHSRFGGVVPEIASRKHIEAICGVCDECFARAAQRLSVDSLTWSDMDAVSVTYAPGLVGALVVGMAFAKGAAWGADKPLVGVNHLEGHIYANKLACPDIEPPMVVSLVSGGHTMLVHVRDWGSYETMGSTIDDAVGEAFDKVAKALGLGYPGGPIISRLAAQGDAKAIRFPRALMHSGDLCFSLSGLKTSVITYIDKQRKAGAELNVPNIAASFEAAVVDVQVAKARTAVQQTGARELCLGGGVSANPMLREAYTAMCAEEGVRLTMPPLAACTDNAAMIALAALDRFKRGKTMGWDADVTAHAPLDDEY